jgi:hypothetical protein
MPTGVRPVGRLCKRWQAGPSPAAVASSFALSGAGGRNRTVDLLFTRQLLCQLSYAG